MSLGLCLSAACARAPFEEPAALVSPVTPALERRAERACGLAWQSRVVRRRVAGEELARRLEAEYDALLSEADAKRAERELVSLGLAAEEVDLRAVLRELGAAATLGYYSTRLEELVLGDATAAGIAPDALQVHELCHALQDQNGVLPQTLLGLYGHDDLAFAIAAVLEGHAVRAERRDAWARGEAPGATVEDADVAGYRAAFPQLPAIVVESTIAVYPAGTRFVAHVEERLGQGGVRSLLTSPPLSSEQLLEPAKALPGAAYDPPRRVELVLPAGAGCRTTGENTLGLFGLGLWLEERLGVERDDARGWDGDRFVVRDCPGGRQLAWALVLDSEADARRLLPLLRAGVDGLSGYRGPAVVAREGARVLVARGLEADVVRAALEGMRIEEVDSLSDWLGAHPEVLERARALRAAGSRRRLRRAARRRPSRPARRAWPRPTTAAAACGRDPRDRSR